MASIPRVSPLLAVRARFLAAMGIGVAAGCQPSASQEPVLVPLATGSVSAATESADAGKPESEPVAEKIPGRTVPFPPEPKCSGGPCAENVQCIEPSPEPLKEHYASPFERCATDRGNFSKRRTIDARKDDSAAQTCCYVNIMYPPIGRPLRDATGALRSVSSRVTGSCKFDTISCEPHDLELAKDWQSAAELEHASVAAFARVALDMAALGAPLDLMVRAHAAAIDEVGHASDSYERARAHGAGNLEPAEIAPVTMRAPDLRAFVRETFLDGCVGETLAALEAREASERERDGRTKRVLARIAEDEERHAELAWRALSWAIAEGGGDARRALEGALAALGPVGSLYPAPRTRMTCAERTALFEDAIASVVRPCASALLERSP